jgi:hypothetical protein
MRNRVHDLTVDFSNGVVAGTGTRIGILDYEGLASLVSESSVVEYAMRDGGYVAATRAGTRRLMFALDFGDTDIGWADVPRLFPLGGVLPLTITRDGVTRRVRAVRDVDLVPLGGGGALDPVSYQIALLAPEPYLLRDTSELLAENGSTGGLEYPVEYTAAGISYEEIGTDLSVSFECVNDGDYPVGFRLGVVPRSAAELTLISGGTVMQLAAVESGQQLIIDTVNSTITLDGENAFGLLETDEWIELPVGVSTLVLAGLVGTAVLEFTPVFESV